MTFRWQLALVACGFLAAVSIFMPDSRAILAPFGFLVNALLIIIVAMQEQIMEERK